MKLLNKEGVLNLQKYNPNRFCGVYFLLHQHDIVYVGSSICVYSRVQEHLKTKIFDSFVFIHTDKDNRLQIEELYINKFLPKYNKALQGASYRSEEWIRAVLKKAGRRDITRRFKFILKTKNIERHKTQKNLISVNSFNKALNVNLYLLNYAI